MSTLERVIFDLPLSDWQPAVVQLLDESHLAAWSSDHDRRIRFAATIAEFLEHQRDTQIIHIYGEHVTDLASLTSQLERTLLIDGCARKPGVRGLEQLLRAEPAFLTHTPPRLRYYIWHDADTMIRSNPLEFGQAFQAIAGIAAEAEYALDEPLTIHRAVLVGSPVLDVYAEDSSARFSRWDDQAPWPELTGIDRPEVLSRPIEDLLDL